MWGKRRPVPSAAPGIRNIPTRVGKTKTGSRTLRPIAEHPHACGENATTEDRKGVRDGTSPRVWGKQHDRERPRPTDRNIPTRVGKTVVFLGNFRIPRKEFGIAQGRKRLHSTITSDTWSIVKEQSQMFIKRHLDRSEGFKQSACFPKTSVKYL